MAGWGRLLVDRSKIHDDLRLLDMAVKQRWDIGDEFREEIIRRLKTIIVEGKDDELALKAISQARQMESQNQKDEHKKLDEFSQRVITLAGRLGIDLAAIGIGETSEDAASGGNAGFISAEEKRT